MNTMMVKGVKVNNKNKKFYLSVPSSDAEIIQYAISHKMIESLENEMKTISSVMTGSILEAFLNDGKWKDKKRKSKRRK